MIRSAANVPRLVAAVLCLLLLVSPAAAAPNPDRGLFVSMIQDPPVLSDASEIERLIKFAKEKHIRTLYVQVYRENKAWFPSKLADTADHQEACARLGADPLGILIERAHKSGVEVHAWMNLLSLSANARAPILLRYGPSILTRDKTEKRSLDDHKIDGQFFLEPGDPRVRKEIMALVAEVLDAYPGLDGLQFDYIRYPDMHPAYGQTAVNEHRFRLVTGPDAVSAGAAWEEWQRAQVTSLVRDLSREARSRRPGIRVSTTGLMPYSRARLEAFQDWRFWIETGLTDFVTLMCYSPDERLYDSYLKDAARNGIPGKVHLAIGAYQLTAVPEVFKRRFRACEDSSVEECVVFHYGDLVADPELTAALS